MSKAEQLVRRFKNCNGPFPYKDLVRLLKGLGYIEKTTGGGSRRRFLNPEINDVIRLHEPHPGNEVKRYVVHELQAHLEDRGLI